MTQNNEPNKKQTVVVSGDIAIDWFTIRQKAGSGSGHQLYNWQQVGGVECFALPGGAMLLGELVEKFLPNSTVKIQSLPNASREFKSHQEYLAYLRTITPDKVIHSQAELDFFEEDLRPAISGMAAKNIPPKKDIMRVKEFDGFCGPVEGKVAFGPVAGDDGNTDLLIIDDAGNGYRDDKSAWPKALENQKKPFIIYKHHRPLFDGELFNIIKEHKAQTICILEADDLRRLGLNISKGLSWEKTAEDFRDTLSLSTALDILVGMRAIVIRLGLEGAIIWLPGVKNKQGEENGRDKLVICYTSQMLEGGLSERCPGKINGAGEAFVAGLAQTLPINELIKQDYQALIEKTVCSAVKASISHHYLGFKRSDTTIEYDVEGKDSLLSQMKDQVCAIDIKDAKIPGVSLDEQWSIANNKMGMQLEDNAVQWVRTGDFGSLGSVPVVAFGQFLSIDRHEIESYTSVCALFKKYGSRDESRGNDKPEPPLSIAVFGQPGSGKSYGVKQVIKSLKSYFKSKFLEFNLSQFHDPAELIAVFHQVREAALEGIVPVAFFDEFDSAFENTPLAWLRHFLSPMQDGVFSDNNTIHRIGKCIFVFAGGTRHSFRSFCDSYTTEAYNGIKTRDFISRLKGHVDVCGPNALELKDPSPRSLSIDDNQDAVAVKTRPSIGNSRQARAAVMRRALILRGILENKFKRLINDKGTAQVDETIIRALLRVPHFTYGVRSMEAIFHMSDTRSGKLDPSSLPAGHLLGMHVDADVFNRLMLYAASREKLAKAAHEIYREKNQGKPDTPLADLTWEMLPEHNRADNRRQIDEIPERLADARFRYIARTATSRKADEFSKNEIEHLACNEHERWVRDKLFDGWVWGEDTIREKKIHASLVPWDKLPDTEKEKDRDAVRAIPELLERAGFIMVHDYNE